MPSAKNSKIRLAVVVSHPIQYFSPWFEDISRTEGIDLCVFYLQSVPKSQSFDRGFGRVIEWDIPLLSGYNYTFAGHGANTQAPSDFFSAKGGNIVRIIESFRPDVVLLFGYGYIGYIRVALSLRLLPVPIILRGDSTDLGRGRSLKSKISHLIRSILFKRFKAFLYVGSANKAFLINHGVEPNRLTSSPHFVDNARFSSASLDCDFISKIKEQLLLQSRDSVVVGFVGKLETKKRPLDLILASEKLRYVLSKLVKYVFIGDGHLLEKLRSDAGERLGKSVFFIPFVNQRQMPSVYSILDLICLPSGFGETWGLCINEAMNQGVPAVVSSSVGCGPDLVLEGKAGRIFETGNIEKLASALQHVLTLRISRTGYHKNDIIEHVQKFSMQAATYGLTKAINDILVENVK